MLQEWTILLLKCSLITETAILTYLPNSIRNVRGKKRKEKKKQQSMFVLLETAKFDED